MCLKPHHLLLYRYSSDSSPSELASTQKPIVTQPLTTSAGYHAMTADSNQIVLAPVNIIGSNFQIHIARVLLGSGSTQELSKVLKLNRDRRDTNLLGTGQSNVSARHVVQATIQSRTQPF